MHESMNFYLAFTCTCAHGGTRSRLCRIQKEKKVCLIQFPNAQSLFVFCAINDPTPARSRTFAEEFEERRPGQGASDLQPLGHHGRRDELVVRNFFVQLVVRRLVEEDQVVQLVPHLPFGPLLLQTKTTRVKHQIMHRS